MTWLLIAIAAQFILGTSAVFDKVLLKRSFFDPVVYTFWLGILGILTYFLLPLGSLTVAGSVMTTALFGGAIFIAGILLLFMALGKGEASTVLPLIGGLTPVFTLLFAAILLDNPFTWVDAIGFLFLISGGFLFFLAEKLEFRMTVIAYGVSSAILLGLSSTLTKIVFNETAFVTGLIWLKTGGVLFAASFLFIPALRARIFTESSRSGVGSKTLYLANRAYAAGGSVLISVAIFLAHPALVEATQAFRYAIIFLLGAFLLRERFYAKILSEKLAASVIVIIGLIVVGVTAYARSIPVDMGRDITWGITFSSKFSQQLGNDWQSNLKAIIRVLQPDKLRLVAYWDEIEKERGTFDFSDLDWQIEQARGADIPVTIAIGMRVPRWPECFIPAWAHDLPPKEREAALRDYLRAVIERYRADPVIERWQLENEPFLRFGLCPERPSDFFEREYELLKSLDSSRQALVTDSGEFGTWYRAAKTGDIFGTTMYRRVYPPSVGHITGVIDYPIGPSFFRLKEKAIRFLLRDHDKTFIVAELQAEPWGKYILTEMTYEEHLKLFPIEYFRDTIEFAKQTGFNEYFLWGVEWWYWTGAKHDNWEYWELVKNIIREAGGRDGI